jgi:hypothetical protein
VFSTKRMLRPHRILLPALLALAALSAPLGGCNSRYIANTDVEDSAENRKLITFCEKYRHAVEHKDIDVLLKVASPTYYEDGGNVDSADDLDYAGLRAYLESKFQEAEAIRYEIRYRRVVKEGDVFYVDYTYTASYRIPGTKADEWRHRVEDNRLEIVPFQDDYRITAGM